jgi:hypothetical protein
MNVRPIVAAALLVLAAAPSPPRAHVMARHAAAEQQANGTRTAADIDRDGDRETLDVFEIAGDGSNGATGTVQPGAGDYEQKSGATVSDRQINVPPDGHYTTATSNAGHDGPAVVLPHDGSVIVTYGAASTYRSYHPPDAWACLQRQFCEPFKRVRLSDRGNLADALAHAPEALLPSSGLSEMSAATVDGATIMAGQQQVATVHGESGAQGYVSYRGADRFDTAAGTYDASSEHAPSGDGLYTITRAPNDNAYVEFAIVSARGAGTIHLDADGRTCTLANLPASSPDEAAQAFVQYANNSCPAFHERFSAVTPQFDPLQARLGGSPVGLELRSGDVRALPGVSDVHLACSGGIACASPRGADTVYDVRDAGIHRHFLFGKVVHQGPYVYDLLDVEQVTGSWYGQEHNSLALALACFRTTGPQGAAWIWTDCGGGHQFRLDPGETPAPRLNAGSPYLVRAPRGGFPPGMVPFIDDWSMEAQPPHNPAPYPVISTESAARLSDGSLLIAYGCQSAERHDAICYVQLDAQGATERAGFVDDPAGGGSLPSIAIDAHGQSVTLAALVGIASRWGCDGSGGCALLYRFDDRSHRWTRTAAESLGGRNDAGFAGTVAPTAQGFIFAYRDLIGDGHARVVTFERAVR